MTKKQAISILLIVIAFISLSVVFLLNSAAPKFRVENRSPSPVHVVSYWRNESKDLGLLNSGDIVIFEINAEAAMTFKVTLSNGEVIITEPMYFTSGTKIYAQINEKGVDVSSST
ncbi:hypothetical protein FE810_05325 [Thalassotalea litorea]|uniref:Uncharacterized protein n=1 Tax=Thalassotalea litorea TaxID=2020715 RepID=A0A5R9INV9_9GAMM|nr:hypothetical protein [Thalassotalea litorea]TLU66143.1 hypothetical protein FE810_05325 [Thalassotalea litorea]